jgi:PHD/YefM family antitoxin component YafN of YafNO toxin-antitoxin module
MATVSATDAKNRIGDLWDMADHEPVTVERNGVAKYQVISTAHFIAVPLEEYARLKSARRAPRFGFAREQFEGFDSEALLAVDISAELEGEL